MKWIQTLGERSIFPFESCRERDCYHWRRKVCAFVIVQEILSVIDICQYQPEIRIAAWAILIFQLFERPPWTFHRDNWDNSSIFPNSGIPVISDGVLMPLLLVFLVAIGWAVALEAGYEIFAMWGGSHDKMPRILPFPIKDGTGRKVPRLLFLLTALVWLVAFVQVVVALFSFIGGYNGRPFWLSPTLSLFVILAERSSSRRFSYLLRILPNFIALILILAGFVALFTAVAFFIFSPDSTEKQMYFPDFESGMWNMMMILVGSNWPGPIIPAIQVILCMCSLLRDVKINADFRITAVIFSSFLCFY